MRTEGPLVTECLTHFPGLREKAGDRQKLKEAKKEGSGTEQKRSRRHPKALEAPNQKTWAAVWHVLK